MPLPRPETTPPVTKIYLVDIHTSSTSISIIPIYYYTHVTLQKSRFRSSAVQISHPCPVDRASGFRLKKFLTKLPARTKAITVFCADRQCGCRLPRCDAADQGSSSSSSNRAEATSPRLVRVSIAPLLNKAVGLRSRSCRFFSISVALCAVNEPQLGDFIQSGFAFSARSTGASRLVVAGRDLYGLPELDGRERLAQHQHTEILQLVSRSARQCRSWPEG